ncbi:hypothetical protein HDC34_002274 [Pseudoclavibacter sp. JAI123]|nr:hypothetical protein [Pseudoclavibacter sp. JAI123]
MGEASGAGGGAAGGAGSTTGGTSSGVDGLAVGDEYSDEERWLVVKGRRWRRTDPSLPTDVVERLKSHLGRGRSGVGAAKRRGDDSAVAASRKRVGLAKHGLGERGPRWWEEPEAARLERAREALAELDELDRTTPESV